MALDRLERGEFRFAGGAVKWTRKPPRRDRIAVLDGTGDRMRLRVRARIEPPFLDIVLHPRRRDIRQPEINLHRDHLGPIVDGFPKRDHFIDEHPGVLIVEVDLVTVGHGGQKIFVDQFRRRGRHQHKRQANGQRRSSCHRFSLSPWPSRRESDAISDGKMGARTKPVAMTIMRPEKMA